jgi:leucyl aminopeptidase
MITASVLALTLIAGAPANAQDVMGSGIAASEAENSVAREIRFAAVVPQGAALAIVAPGGMLPAETPLSDGERAAVQSAIASAEFEGKQGETLSLRGIGAWPAVLLAGIEEAPDANDWRETGAELAQGLKGERHELAIVGMGDAAATAEAAMGFALGQYSFDRYKSDSEDDGTALAAVFTGSQADAARALWQARQSHLAEAVRFARDLVNEPASAVYPESFIARTRAAFAGVPNVKIEVLDQADFRRLGLGAIAGVGQGSPRGARMMIITYEGAGGSPLALIGKGITFDSGGISLKPNSGMWAMKGDMSGAAAVTGAALSLARSRAPVNIVAVAALAENMPDGNAQRPGDIVRTMSGKTIEIRSTDAEGRLVLSDAIEYTVANYKPRALVDIATLTGAVIGALGSEYAGLFTRQDDVATRVSEAAERAGEPVWRLPLHPNYAKAIKSDYADIKNSDTSPAPGASSGAHFVGHFVPEELDWAHIDMAGVDMPDNPGAILPMGASGYGVRLLDELARSWPAAE